MNTVRFHFALDTVKSNSQTHKIKDWLPGSGEGRKGYIGLKSNKNCSLGRGMVVIVAQHYEYL